MRPLHAPISNTIRDFASPSDLGPGRDNTSVITQSAVLWSKKRARLDLTSKFLVATLGHRHLDRP